MMAIGACGVMNAVGNLAPRRIADLCELVFAEKLAEARAAHFALFELNQSVFFDTNPIPLKYMMKRLGLIRHNEHRLPMVPATRESRNVSTACSSAPGCFSLRRNTLSRRTAVEKEIAGIRIPDSRLTTEATELAREASPPPFAE